MLDRGSVGRDSRLFNEVMHMRNRLLLLCLLAAVLSMAKGGEVMALEIRSSAFKNGDFIPARYTCKGEDLSPPLEWDNVPEGTKGFALISDDPDAPMGTWVHWVIYGIPPDKRSLPEGVSKDKILGNGSKQGVNDFRRIGYGGPCPPPGPVHRYFFKLYVLDSELNLGPGLTKDQLLKAIKGHVVEEAQLMGKFKR